MVPGTRDRPVLLAGVLWGLRKELAVDESVTCPVPVGLANSLAAFNTLRNACLPESLGRTQLIIGFADLPGAWFALCGNEMD